VSAYSDRTSRPKFELFNAQFRINVFLQLGTPCLSKPLQPQMNLRSIEMFNALKYIKALEGVGFPREQAEAQVQLIIDSFQENVATKADLAELKADVRSEMSELKSQMAEMKTDLVFRLGSLIVVCTGLLGVLIKF
jgi:hypothetical protein